MKPPYNNSKIRAFNDARLYSNKNNLLFNNFFDVFYDYFFYKK